MKRILMLLTILLIPFLLSGCYIKKTFKYDDYIKYLDNKNCDINDPQKAPCNLKGKYEVVSENLNLEKPYMEFKIKDTDIVFKVFQTYSCSGTLDGSGCFGKKDVLRDNYNGNATRYYIEKYDEQIGVDSCREKFPDGKCYYTSLPAISTKENLKETIDYLNGFIDYINKLDYRVLERYTHFVSRFSSTTNPNGKEISISFYIDIDNNGKYVYRTYYKNGSNPHLYEAEDGKLETFIDNYMREKNITLN